MLSKKNYKDYKFFIFLFLVTFINFSCGKSDNSQKIILGSSGKIESLDPARINTIKSLQVLSSLGDTLYELSKDGQLIPKLALDRPSFSEDKLKIFINLRKDVFFHDGTKFDSHAMKFTLNRFKKIGTKSYIIGNKIKSIDTPSKYKLVINLNMPSSSIEGLLTSLNLTPVSPSFYENYNNKFLNDEFVGTGKYILRRFSNEVQIIEPNINYWGEKPNNKGINIVGYSNSNSLYGALKSKQIDVLLSNSIDDSQRHKLKKLSEKFQIREGISAPNEISFISLRTNKAPLNNLNIRLAIAKSLNRDLISQKVSYGLRRPAKSIIPKIFKKNKGGFWPSYNVQEAKRILKEEGFCDGEILNLPLTYRSNVPTDKLIALAWQQDVTTSMNDCLSLEINGLESTTIYKNLSEGIYTAVILDWIGAYSDPEAYLKPLLSCNEFVESNCIQGESVFSGSFWASKEVEDLFKESESLYGLDRLNKLIKIETIASQSLPYIPIWFSSQKAWSQKNISEPVFNGSGQIIMSKLEHLNE
tara:strand:- start:11719 stop:13305 length:1587 start_codon:yes stop_codon:yes gene_type:complete